MSRPVVSIAFCADCGYEGQATELAGAVLRAFGHDLAQVTLIPWDEATFDVTVDGALLHSMARDGGFPSAPAVVADIRARIALPQGEGSR